MSPKLTVMWSVVNADWRRLRLDHRRGSRAGVGWVLRRRETVMVEVVGLRSL